jgi:hypothetical protein
MVIAVGLFTEIENIFPLYMIQAQVSNPIDNNFLMSGQLSSFISTPQSNWIVNGNWTLKIQNGNLSYFEAYMRWDPTNLTKTTTISHSHSFSNFRVEPHTNQNIFVNSKNITDIKGIMDVGLNLKKDTWKDVPAEIKTAGKTITISLDDSKTSHHFNHFPIFGKIIAISKFSNNQNVSITSTNNTENLNSNNNSSRFLSSSINEQKLPLANAGSPQTVSEGYIVLLNGSKSYDPDGGTITYSWRQIAGPFVKLDDTTIELPSLTAPHVSKDTKLVFELTVKDDRGLKNSSTVIITDKHNIPSTTSQAPPPKTQPRIFHSGHHHHNHHHHHHHQ